MRDSCGDRARPSRNSNPIAVAGPEPNVGGVDRLLVNGADARRVAAHLAQLVRVSMGVPERKVPALLPVAHKLLDLQISRSGTDERAIEARLARDRVVHSLFNVRR